MKDIDFSNIRPIEGDIKKGFEEFVCQLAKRETVPNPVNFIRNGTPDAGCECYWILSDDSEWAWQAKYFKESIDNNQFTQIRNSVDTALKKHPKIKKYFIAINRDLSDSRQEGKKTEREKWDKFLNKLKETYKVEFIAWFSSDLIEKLQNSQNMNLIKFWFDKNFITEKWIIEQNNKAIKDLGARYTPELNIQLDISEIFDGLSQNDRFKKLYENKLDEFLKKINELLVYYKKKSNNYVNLKNDIDSIEKNKNSLISYYKQNNFDFKFINNICLKTQQNIDNLFSAKKEDYLTYLLNETKKTFYIFYEFVQSDTVKVFDNPYLVIEGKAGSGKSHLLADFVNQRSQCNTYSIFLLGHKFREKCDPREQIIKQLGLQCSFDDFLCSLQCLCDINNNRIIIIVDAINEGSGKNFWKDELNSFTSDIKRYKNLGLVLSVRSTYFSLFENNLKDFVRINHTGFGRYTYDAIKHFCIFYKIPMTAIPLLSPEFSNPLFLKLFCKGLKNQYKPNIMSDTINFSCIFDSYISHINEELYNSSAKIINEFLDNICKEEIKNNFLSISYTKCLKLFADINKKYNQSNKSLEDVISTGILIKDFSIIQHEEFVDISYEKLKDYLIAKIISNYSTYKLKNFIKNFIYHQGIINSLSIVLPKIKNYEIFEVCKLELFFFKILTFLVTVFPKIKKFNDWKNKYLYLKKSINNAFLSSLPYRNNNDKNKKQLQKYIKKNKLYFLPKFLNSIILCSTKTNNIFSVKEIHNWLNKFSMADRDSFWLPFLNNSNNVNPIIDWALSFSDEANIPDSYIESIGIILSWFLASSNRNLRDKTTKSLVVLLMDRSWLVLHILKTFEKINDPYIYERLYAVAYGVSLRTDNTKILIELSEYIYATIFNKEEIYPHILLRDYARNIIEYTKYLDIKLNIDFKKIRPPYKSIFPKIVTDKEIECYKKEEYTGSQYILSSMEVEYDRNRECACYGDFGRYVFQSNIDDFVQNEMKKEDFIMNMKNIAIKYVFCMGYDDKKHGIFDKEEKAKHIDRYYKKTERIGKKYQWIAMYKLLAQLTDKYKIKKLWNNVISDYKGAWEFCNIRDIDTTNLNKLFDLKIEDKILYNNWNMKNDDWIKTTNNLPYPVKIIKYNNYKWIPLNAFYNFDEPTEIGQRTFCPNKKDLWYLINSYFVNNDEFDRIHEWLSKQNFSGRWLPEVDSLYEIFNREYVWSPSFKAFDNNCYSELEKNTGKVYFTEAPSYSWTNCDGNSIHIKKPCKLLFEYFKLIYKQYDNCLYLPNKDLACFDNDGILYFRLDLLDKFLTDKNFKLIWTVLGEKRVIKSLSDSFYNQDWLEISGLYTLTNDGVNGNFTNVVPKKNY